MLEAEKLPTRGVTGEKLYRIVTRMVCPGLALAARSDSLKQIKMKPTLGLVGYMPAGYGQLGQCAGLIGGLGSISVRSAASLFTACRTAASLS